MPVLYYRNRDGSIAQNNVPQSDVSYWVSQGWSTSQPSAQPQASTPAPAAPTPAPAQSTPSSQTSFSPETTKQDQASIPAGYVRISEQQANQIQSGASTDYEDIRFVRSLSGNNVVATAYAYPIPKATLVNAQGQRVVVRTDGKTGSRIPSSQEMMSQGYRLEKAPGVPVEPFTNQSQNTQQTKTGGAIDQRQSPDIITSDGRRITASDPQYTQYLSIPGTIQINPQTNQIIPNTIGNIQTFADGSQLNTQTGQPVRGRLDNIPTASGGSSTGAPSTSSQTGQNVLLRPSQFSQLQAQGLTENDIQRNGVDIYLKPTSRFYSQVAGNQETGGTGTGTAMGTDPTQMGSNSVDAADRTWINQLYKKYFDRDATSSEMMNWARESPQALDQFLQKEAKTYGYTSSYFKDEGNQRLEAAMNIINNSNLPQNLKDLWAATVKSYPSGMEYNADEVLKTFNQIKTSTIDPQFAELATIASRDFQRNLNEQKAKFEMDQETIRANAGENIRQAKEGLEKSGMTFSGKAIEDLGASSAYAQPGTTQGGAIPQQEPFGGLFYEGKVNQQNRLMASSASLANKSTLDALNASLEQQLGSNAAAAAGATVQGGITGALETQRQNQYGQTLQQIMDNYRKKQTLNTNITT